MASGDLVLKVLVIGDVATGKTSIIKRAMTNYFSEFHKPTIGVDFHFRRIEVDGVSVALQLWDIAGQDRYGAVIRVYFKDSFGALLVFDLSREDTFNSVLKWKRELDSKVCLPNGKPLPVLLVANKCDLPDTRVDKSLLDGFCAEHGFIGWIETSAKTNHNIEQSINTLVSNILTHQDAYDIQRLQGGEAAGASGGDSISLDADKAAKDKEASSCC